jgi:hypothetical protein
MDAPIPNGSAKEGGWTGTDPLVTIGIQGRAQSHVAIGIADFKPYPARDCPTVSRSQY